MLHLVRTTPRTRRPSSHSPIRSTAFARACVHAETRARMRAYARTRALARAHARTLSRAQGSRMPARPHARPPAYACRLACRMLVHPHAMQESHVVTPCHFDGYQTVSLFIGPGNRGHIQTSTVYIQNFQV